MAPASTATRARRAPQGAPAARRPPLEVVQRGGRPRRVRRSSLALPLILVVGSLLLVAGSEAYLTAGQVRLARLQQQLVDQQSKQRDLELQVARLEDPSHVVGQGQQQGLSSPSQVTDLPLVTTTVPSTAPAHSTPAPTAGGKR